MIIKRVLLILFIALLLPAICSANEIPIAAPNNLASALRVFPGFTEMKDGTLWEYVPYEICAMREYIASEAKKARIFSGFYFSIQGETETNLVFPVLHIFYKDDSSIAQGQSASFLVENTRYDFVCDSKKTSIGDIELNMMTIPLDKNGLDFWRKTCLADRMMLQIFGKITYTDNFENSNSPNTFSKQLSNAFLNGNRILLTTMDQIFSLDSYLLWDLNAALCSQFFDVQPNMVKTDGLWAIEAEPFSDSLMGIVSIGSRGKSVKIIQSALIEKGFLIGTPDGDFDLQMKNAVLLAQQHYGLSCTGFADRELAELLKKNTHAVKLMSGNFIKTDHFCTQIKSDNTHMTLTRYWFASKLFARKADSFMGNYTCNNEDEILIIVDGIVKNITANPVHSANEYDICYRLDSVEFPAMVFFEANGCAELQESLLPMTETRIMIISRIPLAFMKDEKLSMSIMINQEEMHMSLNEQIFNAM